MVKDDLITQIHSNSCYRAMILLFLFHPTRCSSDFYTEVMPSWLESWSSIDRCHEFDILWINMFCRARRYVSPEKYDWGPLRKRLLTLCGYWLQIPVGGKSNDKSFPRAAEAKSRTIPSRLKSFVRSDSTYQEGVDFVAKVTKLLVFCCGKNDVADESEDIDDSEDKKRVSHGTKDILRFFSFVGPYFNPSNVGSWTFPLGVMLHYFSFELCRRLGRDTSQTSLNQVLPHLATKIAEVEPFKQSSSIPDHEIVLILDSILPLCQQALYSKSSHVSRAGEAALLYLVQIDYKICAPLLDFAMRALDVSSVTQSHQAPAALSTMNRMILPSLRKNPSILLERLPEILQLSLAGIDSNDEEKTIRTLVFYRTLTSWLPVGNGERLVDAVSLQNADDIVKNWRFGKSDLIDVLSYNSDSKSFWNSLKQLPSSSILVQQKSAEPFDPANEETRLRALNLAEEAGNAMADWSISFLDRIYGLFRAAGEQEKIGKSHRVATKRSSAADVSRARHFTRILNECLRQFFAAMDDETLICAMNSVRCFLIDESHSLAVKYASALCESICAARAIPNKKDANMSFGLTNLALPLTSDIRDLSKNTVLYRMRCLAGAVRRGGSEVLTYRTHILSTLEFALAHENKHIFKAGCKLLRHTLSSQSESYPLCSDSCPRIGSTVCLGESAQLNDDKIQWHVPTGVQIDFVAELLSIFVYSRIKNISSHSDFVFVEKNNDTDVETSRVSSKHDFLVEWRKCLRILRYCVRGCPGLLIEMGHKTEAGKEVDPDPNEEASKALIELSSPTSQSIILSSRERISRLIIAFLSLITKESASHHLTIKKNRGESSRKFNVAELITSDIKICKEVAAISQLLFARRSVSFRSDDSFELWKAQKDVNNNKVLLSHRKEISTVLQKAECVSSKLIQTYSDGEEGGKSLPRRMVCNRVEIFLHSFQRSASFEVPRRMRRERGIGSIASIKLLASEIDVEQFYNNINRLIDTNDESELSRQFFAIDKYESILDGTFALACHHNSSIRGYGIRAVQYGFSRFGWLALERAPRLISAIALEDNQPQTEDVILSCAKLSAHDEPSVRKRLSEVLKGVCLIMVVPRLMKEIMSSEELRMRLLKALCKTQHVISLLPADEMQKMISYFHQIFTGFRSRFFTMPQMTKETKKLYQQAIAQFLVLLAEEKKEDTDISSSLNWRNRLLVCWFVTTLSDKRFFFSGQNDLVNEMWETCIFLIQNESGQPLQKVALGLFGRLVNISRHISEKIPSSIQNKIAEENFCRDFCKALVYNHKEDRSVGGGHHAQWSLGVSEILRDSASNIAPKTMFPFLRTGRSNNHFKVSHAHLVHILLSNMDTKLSEKTVKYLLTVVGELAASPPSEDQRNQLCTSAEIFSGIFVGLLQQRKVSELHIASFNEIIIPCLDAAIEIVPSSALGAFLDAIRYGMSKVNPSINELLCSWSITKIESSLWKPDDDGLASAVDGFATQTKWLAVMNVILIQMDFQTDSDMYIPWNLRLHLIGIYSNSKVDDIQKARKSLSAPWKLVCNRLLPRLLIALGHPYQSCRERIASVLFRVAYCHRNQNHALQDHTEVTNPCDLILSKFHSLGNSIEKFSKLYQHSLITSRLFLSHCVHNGESMKEFSQYIIPLLSFAFGATKPAVDKDEAKEDDPEIRMLQGQVVQAYRHSISEISVSCIIAYGSSIDLSRVLESLDSVSKQSTWQVRLAVAHYLRCFQGNHKFLFTYKQTKKATKIVARLLADDRREVSAAAMAALTGILAASPLSTVAALVEKYRKKAHNSVIKKTRKKKMIEESLVEQTKEELALEKEKEKERVVKQQTSVYFLCAAILSTPYETPSYVPVALAALSKHSYERSAPFAVRETVKMCCGEYKRTHMSDNWEIHRKQFTQEQLEALEDVVSTPHYYA